ncbi:hypothetical protein [Chryseobacterium gambrini]|uniref:hypothetical protein n=1 Tax=Chryseobacterium gambrini TaxID=373672 RepID=UPI0022F398DC|nr:hypothetical protein [Chryseobacterium gambrini]WBX99459.1 hypothetical protein PE065_09440 [Chryseobacterium gambrini]
MKIKITLLSLVLCIISCKENISKNTSSPKDTLTSNKNIGYTYKPVDASTECYYSINDKENILMDLKKDTLITDKGEFAIRKVLDDKKSNIYHIYEKNNEIATTIEDPSNDDTYKFYISTPYVINKNEEYHLYRTDGDNLLINKSLSKEKKKFLKKYKVIN